MEMTIHTQRERQATFADELAFTKIKQVLQVHWDAVPDDWSCPCCERAKRQVVQPSNDQKFSFILHESRWYGGNEGTYICNECKITLEGIAKHADVDKAQVTYQDMRELVIVVPNGSHRPRKREAVDVKIEEISMRYLLE